MQLGHWPRLLKTMSFFVHPQEGESLAADSEEEEGIAGAGASTRAEVGSSIAGSRQAGASAGGAKGGRCGKNASGTDACTIRQLPADTVLPCQV